MNSANENLNVIFINNLNELMKKRCISQQDLSRDLGLPAATISSWLKGRRTPRPDKIRMLAEYFGVNETDLTNNYMTTKKSLEKTIKNKFKDMDAVYFKIEKGIPLTEDDRWLIKDALLSTKDHIQAMYDNKFNAKSNNGSKPTKTETEIFDITKNLNRDGQKIILSFTEFISSKDEYKQK